MKLVTFDIFDTTLIRKSGTPDSIFRLMALKLWPEQEDRQTDFVIQRKQAEKKAGRHASINNIYNQFCDADLYPYSIKKVMDMELETEKEMLVQNPKIKEKIETLRKDGWFIKFLSDMYLPSDFLKRILKKEDCIKNEEEVLVSCEYKKRKDSGDFYKFVREKYNPTEWIHFGDNRLSDYRMAKKNGVKAYYVNTQYTKIEKKILSLASSSRNALIYELFSGLMRYLRIKHNNLPEANLAADFVAPFYIPYVLYVLKEAEIQNIRRVHFLSRDGYIMKKIAEVFKPKDLELNYLFVSRKSLNQAYLAYDSQKRFLKVSDRQHLIGRNVDWVLNRLQLNRKDLKEKFGVIFEYNKILSQQQQEDFLNKVFESPHLKEYLDKKFKESLKLTLDYFVQEGLTDGTSQAMVDIGWLGTTRLMINEILTSHHSSPKMEGDRLVNNRGEIKGRNIPTFYIGVREDVYPSKYGSYFSYFPLGVLSTEATGLVENYFSASPWPSTIGYQNEGNKIIPIFEDDKKYLMTDIIENNVKLCEGIAMELKNWIKYFNSNELYNIALASIRTLSEMVYDINVQPMTKVNGFDGPLVKKLNSLELFRLIALGDYVTWFNPGSLSYSVGHSLFKPLWKLHKITSNSRSILYRLSLKLKK